MMDGDYILKIHKNVYGQKQAGSVCNKHLVSKLKFIGFHQCKTDECVLTRGKSIYVLYTDDSILTGPDEAKLEQIVQDMKDTGLDLTVEGDVSDFLGVNIKRYQDGTV